MLINFDGKILAADVPNRTITGMVVPFGVSGRTSAGEVVFEFGSFQQFQAEDIILNKEHSRTDPLGRGIKGSEWHCPKTLSITIS